VISRRRRALPAELVPAREAFQQVLDRLEPAKAALADVLPTTRMPGRPFSDALVAFERGLSEARTFMPGWRRSDVEPQWLACDRGLDAALSAARRVRETASTPAGFEQLLGTVQALLDPLDPFEEAARRFSALRRR
jgi:hypothetical protein